MGMAVWPLACVVIGACGPALPQSGQAAQPGAAAPSRTLVLVVRAEAPTLVGTPLVSLPVNLGSERRIFNAGLAQLDSQAEPIPYLAEALPELNTESWQVFAD